MSFEEEYGFKSYPALLWFRGDGTAEPYEGGGDLESFVRFVTQKSDLEPPIKLPTPPQSRVLDYKDFDEVVMDPENDVLVSFTTPWCNHCKAIKGIWGKVTSIFEPESNCVVVNVDVEGRKNENLARRFNITAVPTIKFFSKDNKEGERFELELTESNFIDYLNEKCGTHRTSDGGLLDTAGRLADFDQLASKFLTASSGDQESIYQEALTLSSTIDDPSKSMQYLRIMENIANGTEGYHEKESKRLEGILSKREVARAKLDEIKIKSNILRAFGAPTEEEEDNNIQRDTAEL